VININLVGNVKKKQRAQVLFYTRVTSLSSDSTMVFVKVSKKMIRRYVGFEKRIILRFNFYFMRKNQIALYIFLILIGLYSCEEPVEGGTLEIDMTKTAHIKGFITAQLDELNDSLSVVYEGVPQGTKLILKVANNEYFLSAGGYRTFETLVDENGRYDFEMPVSSEGINFEIIPVDFEYNQRKAERDNNNVWHETGIEKKYYTASSKTVFNLTTGEIRIVNLQYDEHSY